MNVFLGYALLGGLWSCAVDWDHVWYWVLQVPDPVNLSGIPGRPFHTPVCFLLQSVVAAFVVGLLQSYLVHRRLKDGELLDEPDSLCAFWDLHLLAVPDSSGHVYDGVSSVDGDSLCIDDSRDVGEQ